MSQQIRVMRQPYRMHHLAVWIEYANNNEFMVAEPMVFTKREPYEMNSTPTTTLSPQNAQVLMDDLYAAGIRPTEGTGSAGSLKATQDHLQDMRTLVFKGKKS